MASGTLDFRVIAHGIARENAADYSQFAVLSEILCALACLLLEFVNRDTLEVLESLAIFVHTAADGTDALLGSKVALLRAFGNEATEKVALVGPKELLVAERGVGVLHTHSTLALEALEARGGGGGASRIPFKLASASRAEEDEEKSKAVGHHIAVVE